MNVFELLSLTCIYFQLKRANSDDALTKPAAGAAASGFRMKKTVTTGAISDLAEARPRSTSGKRLSLLYNLI